MIAVTLFFDEDDVYQQQPVRDYLLHYLLYRNVRGASVFPAVMGFGRQHHIHHPGSFGGVDDRSIMMVFIDEEERVREVLPHIKEVVRDGLIVTHRVDVV